MDEPLSRKAFCGGVLAAWALLALPSLSGCGGGGDGGAAPAPSPAAPVPSPAACGNTIGNNHGHVLAVSRADLAAAANAGYGTPQDLFYDIAGTSGHSHVVMLNATHQAVLLAGGAVNVVSSLGDGHTHDVALTCT
ncbi:MAG: hypothetical protein KIT17_03770 [Rubrivivax sp.]|nr:hypothetical protein [Rubrivivax sp.]